MSLYILKRFLLMIPTLFGVMFITFVITQFVPGGPVEKMMAQIEGRGAGGESGGGRSGLYHGKKTLHGRFIKTVQLFQLVNALLIKPLFPLIKT